MSDSTHNSCAGALHGRHAMVTGGGQGIGAAIARQLLAQGASVTVLGRKTAALQTVVALAPERCHAVSADVADAEQLATAFAQAVARFGAIDILVNNAGQAVSAPLMKTDQAMWNNMFAVNVTGTLLCIQQVVPQMRASGWGRIVNVASTAGLTGYPYVSAYCATKHAVLGLTKSLALELATQGITVNAVCPGYTDTDIVRSAIDRIVQTTGRSQEQALGELVRGNPQQRLVQPQEVADTVLWLCGAGATAITGQAIAVAGGEVL